MEFVRSPTPKSRSILLELPECEDAFPARLPLLYLASDTFTSKFSHRSIEFESTLKMNTSDIRLLMVGLYFDLNKKN